MIGGLTAGIVSIPIAMGYGIISGLGPAAGLYGAVATALVYGIVGGTRGLLAGPNIVIAFIVAIVVSEHASSLPEAATIGILAGLIQLVFGLLRLGRFVAYLPFSLVAGFFTAFGIMVILSQSFAAIGAEAASHDLIENVKAWPDALAGRSGDAIALTVCCLAIAIFWRGRPSRLLPSAFIMLVVGTVLGEFWLDSAPRLDVPLGLPSMDLPDISPQFFLDVLEPAFIIALIGSITILIVSLSLDVITGSEHSPDRNLFALGLSSIASGSIGGLAGSVGAQTYVNVFSGGRTGVAGLTVALVLIAVLAFCGPIVERIPLAVLAATMIAAGWTLIDWRVIRNLHRMPFSYALVATLCCVLTVTVGLTTGLVVALVVASLTGARGRESLELRSLISVPLLDRMLLRSDELEQRDPDSIYSAQGGLVVFPEQITVASARRASSTLRVDISEHRFAVFDFSNTLFIDDSAAVMVSQLVDIASSEKEKRIIICGLSDDLKDEFTSMGLLTNIPGSAFALNLDEAKEMLRSMLEGAN